MHLKFQVSAGTFLFYWFVKAGILEIQSAWRYHERDVVNRYRKGF
jgi:hypothetical protein